MANYNCTIRTNYFHVKDGNAFEDFMNTVYGEDEITVFKEGDMYGFGCYGSISGVMNSKDEENDECEASYDEFIDGLQKHVSEDDAIIIMEAGNEKLRYVLGSVCVITSHKIKYMDTMDLALDIAKELLNNKEYVTQLDY